MADIEDLLNFSMQQQPTKFAAAFDDIMGQKAVAAIDDMKITVAQNMYAAEEDSVEEDEDDFDLEDDDLDLEDEDLEIDDEDFEDIDWDDEDFDLDDEDLEGFEDDGEDA